MGRTPSQIAEILDEFADSFYQLAGAVVDHDKLKDAGVALRRPDGTPWDLRELASDLRKYELDHPAT